MALFSLGCTTVVSSGTACCAPCRAIRHLPQFESVQRNILRPAGKSANLKYRTYRGLLEEHCKSNKTIKSLRLNKFNDGKRIAFRSCALAMHKQWVHAVASGRVVAVDRLARTALKNGAGIATLLKRYEDAAKQVYKPKRLFARASDLAVGRRASGQDGARHARSSCRRYAPTPLYHPHPERVAEPATQISWQLLSGRGKSYIVPGSLVELIDADLYTPEGTTAANYLFSSQDLMAIGGLIFRSAHERECGRSSERCALDAFSIAEKFCFICDDEAIETEIAHAGATASQRTNKNPATNVPRPCPVSHCKAVVWSYTLEAHVRAEHPSLHSHFKDQYAPGKTEKKLLLPVWSKRFKKGRKSKKGQSAGIEHLVSDRHRTSRAIRDNEEDDSGGEDVPSDAPIEDNDSTWDIPRDDSQEGEDVPGDDEEDASDFDEDEEDKSEDEENPMLDNGSVSESPVDNDPSPQASAAAIPVPLPPAPSSATAASTSGMQTRRRQTHMPRHLWTVVPARWR
ncbi:hypothetical protein GGX14DRAFT_582390 [Mycena pura]|uniref:Uncharacterized protein n=1 Tax=Mycena pura TaxID=153505 RepID=A0AAD7E6C1_9AGAR|nr:hypothetical protein GGX14DRAFT_582390 [Mycena pura]